MLDRDVDLPGQVGERPGDSQQSLRAATAGRLAVAQFDQPSSHSAQLTITSAEKGGASHPLPSQPGQVDIAVLHLSAELPIVVRLLDGDGQWRQDRVEDCVCRGAD